MRPADLLAHCPLTVVRAALEHHRCRRGLRTCNQFAHPPRHVATALSTVVTRIQAWRQKSSHSWGDSPSDILDAIGTIAPCYTQGAPLPGVLQAMEDLERPLRGEIMVDIKRVLDAEANRIKVIRDRRVSDSETLKNVVLSALFAFFTFLGQFLVRSRHRHMCQLGANCPF